MVGPDAKKYLNSQITSNLNTLKAGEFHHSCVLDLAGKVISHFVLCLERNDKIQLVINPSQVEALISRLEKFHISEDLEIIKTNQIAHLYVNQKPTTACFSGNYFAADNFITIGDNDIATNSSEDFKAFSVLTGVPRWSIEIFEGELVNNTTLDELAVNYSKGCYPGQETVAKVDSRRGAAFKPVLLSSKLNSELKSGIIKVSDKKIGEIRSIIHTSSHTYAWALLNRESRVDQNLLTIEVDSLSLEVRVNYLPFIKLDHVSVAVEYYDAAVEAFQENNNSLALELFQQAIKLHPTYEDAFESIGVLYGREGQYDKAIEMMEQLKQINPKCLMAYTNLSLYHMKIGNIETAEKYKSDATLLNFETLGNEAQAKRAQAELQAKKALERDKREKMFLQVLEIDELDAMANNGMGEILLERAELDQAETYFNKAIEGDRKYSVAYLGLAKVLTKLGRTSELKETLNSGIKVASSNGDLMPANEMQSMLLKL